MSDTTIDLTLLQRMLVDLRHDSATFRIELGRLAEKIGTLYTWNDGMQLMRALIQHVDTEIAASDARLQAEIAASEARIKLEIQTEIAAFEARVQAEAAASEARIEAEIQASEGRILAAIRSAGRPGTA